MTPIQEFLDNCYDEDEKYLEEDITIASIIAIKALIYAILNVVGLLWASAAAIRSSVILRDHTAKFVELVGESGWVVREIDEPGMANAWTYGGKNLYITKELRQLITFDETMAIILHEYGHSKEYHVQKQMGARYSLQGMFAAAAAVFPLTSFPAFVLFIAAYWSGMILAPMAYSRHHEWIADSYAIDAGYGKHLASGFKKMMKHFKIENVKCKTRVCRMVRALDNLFSTHPPMQDRIENALKKSELYSALTKSFPVAVKTMANILKVDIKQQVFSDSKLKRMFLSMARINK